MEAEASSPRPRRPVIPSPTPPHPTPQAFMKVGNMSGHPSAASSPQHSQGGAMGGMLPSAPNSGTMTNMAFPTSCE